MRKDMAQKPSGSWGILPQVAFGAVLIGTTLLILGQSALRGSAEIRPGAIFILVIFAVLGIGALIILYLLWKKFRGR